MNDDLHYKISMLPDSPGCYLMKSGGEIIYVGKAVNLKNRVRSYFRGEHTPKVAAMVSRVDDFDIILCRSEFEALTLECNLIKKHKPFYNILLKDDKHYPYLRIDLRECYPRLTLARRMDAHDGARYFGPYIGASALRQVLDEVRRFFPIRPCKLAFPLKTPRRPCIHGQIGQCLAPCTGRVSEEAYAETVQKVMRFLSGGTGDIIRQLQKEMQTASESWNFELAAMLRDKIRDLQGLGTDQQAIQTREIEQDVLAVCVDDVDAMVYLNAVRGGRMESGESFLMSGAGADDPGEILSQFIIQYYEDEHLVPRHVLVQTLPEGERDTLEGWLRQKRGAPVEITVPQRGDKARLIDIAGKNASDALMKYRERAIVKDMRTRQAMQELQQALGLPTLPRRIEGYDISNTSGIYSVAAMVVFQDGLPAKKDYRIFRIKTVEGPNDFASMNEVISRRFIHGLNERRERLEQGLSETGGSFTDFPDVILIDGGPEQLAYAQRAMHACGLEIPMFGLAERFEEVYLPGRSDPIVLPRKGSALHLIQYVRDEAHRFGITHHRALRQKGTISTALTSIPGIGEKKAQALIRHFGSVKGVLGAMPSELREVPGITPALAEAVWAFGNGAKKENE